MTPYQQIYDSFLAKILEDEWNQGMDIEILLADWRQILESAIPHFMFPRVSLEERNQEGFLEILTSSEIQLLATYMKVEWLNRTILSWENIKPLYDERDFSQANLLDKFVKVLEITRKQADRLQSRYYRSIKGRPFNFANLAGGNND